MSAGTDIVTPGEAPVLPEVSTDDILGRLQHKPIIDRIDERTRALIKAQLAPNNTMAELGHFLELCAYHGLDPFAHEAWIAKGRGEDNRLLIMVGRDGLRKIAQRNGLRVDGDVVREADKFKVARDPETRRRSVYHEYEEEFVGEDPTGNPIPASSRGRIKGAWCEVWDARSGEQRGYFYAKMDEYRPTSERKLKYSPWGSQESVMILAAAERQALRQATPLSGLLAVGEDARIAREDLSEGEGSGEPPGIELSPAVQERMERAERLGHVGLADQAYWEYQVGRVDVEIEEKLAEADAELDALETKTRPQAEADLPIDVRDLPEPGTPASEGEGADPGVEVGGTTHGVDEEAKRTEDLRVANEAKRAAVAREEVLRREEARATTTTVPTDEVWTKGPTIHLPQLVADAFGVSTSEARRVIATGGVTLNGQPVAEFDLPADDARDGSLWLGKRRGVLVRVEDSEDSGGGETATVGEGHAPAASSTGSTDEPPASEAAAREYPEVDVEKLRARKRQLLEKGAPPDDAPERVWYDEELDEIDAELQRAGQAEADENPEQERLL